MRKHLLSQNPFEPSREIAKAYVVLKPGAGADAESILELCRKELAAYKVPRLVRFVSEAELPLTVTGKLQKNRLAELFAGDA